jgi:acyl carrier protein
MVVLICLSDDARAFSQSDDMDHKFHEQADQAVRDVLREVLGLDSKRAEALRPDSPLFGALPELDSMAVAGLLTELEDRLGIVIDDDDVDAEMLETFGALTAFAARKLAA